MRLAVAAAQCFPEPLAWAAPAATQRAPHKARRMATASSTSSIAPQVEAVVPCCPARAAAGQGARRVLRLAGRTLARARELWERKPSAAAAGRAWGEGAAAGFAGGRRLGGGRGGPPGG